MKDVTKGILGILAAAVFVLAAGAILLLFLLALIGFIADPAGGGGGPDTLGLDCWQGTLLLALLADGPFLIVAIASGLIAWRFRIQITMLRQRNKGTHNNRVEDIDATAPNPHS